MILNFKRNNYFEQKQIETDIRLPIYLQKLLSLNKNLPISQNIRDMIMNYILLIIAIEQQKCLRCHV